jgi:hypothetical protein
MPSLISKIATADASCAYHEPAFVAVDRQRVGGGDQPGGVEGVDRHVEQQHVRHDIAKAAKVRADVEIGVDGRDLPNRARTQKGRQPADVGVVAPVLHHGEELARLLGGGDHLPRLRHACRQRLLAEHVTAMRQCRQRHWQMRLRHSAVKDDVRLRLRQYRLQLSADHRVRPAVLGGAGARGVRIDVDKAGHRQARDVAHCVQPGAADAAAADQHCCELGSHVLRYFLFIQSFFDARTQSLRKGIIFLRQDFSVFLCAFASK